MRERNYLLEVQDVLRKKREAAEAVSEANRAFIHKEIPEIKEIDAILSSTGAKILSAMLERGGVEEKVAAIREENRALQEKRRELLEKNGYPADYTAVKYDCQMCGDSGYVGIDMCVCMKTCISQMRLKDSELGRLCDTQSFETFDLSYYAPGEERALMEKTLNAMKKFSEGFSSDTTDSLLFVGDTGLGKTHLSTAVGITVIGRGYDVEYKTIQALIDDFEEVQFKGEKSDRIRNYYDCDLLIIDDLGCELSTQFTVSCIYNIINARMNKRKPTLISTNLTQKELRDRYGDRITSRLFGEYIPIVFKGTDVRRQKLKGGRR